MPQPSNSHQAGTTDTYVPRADDDSALDRRLDVGIRTYLWRRPDGPERHPRRWWRGHVACDLEMQELLERVYGLERELKNAMGHVHDLNQAMIEADVHRRNETMKPDALWRLCPFCNHVVRVLDTGRLEAHTVERGPNDYEPCSGSNIVAQRAIVPQGTPATTEYTLGSQTFERPYGGEVCMTFGEQGRPLTPDERATIFRLATALGWGQDQDGGRKQAAIEADTLHRTGEPK